MAGGRRRDADRGRWVTQHGSAPWPLGRRRTFAAFVLTGGVLASRAWSGSDVDALAELPLEDLLQVEVSTVSRHAQRLAEAAAAVHVITAEEIRHAGVRTLPDALRLAPGVDVAQIGADRWAVSLRGHTDYLANKLMVLVDGRSVYSPNFSGVLWNTVQVPLENIERIEVIGGPGGALWGANAVNGIINIITRPAQATQGTLVNAGHGSAEGSFGLARQGGRFDEDTFYSAYVSATRGAGLAAAGREDRPDGNVDSGAGLRIDARRGRDAWMLNSAVYRSRVGGTGRVPDPLAAGAGFGRNVALADDFSGVDVHGRLSRQLDDGGEVQASVAWSHADLDSGLLARERQDIVDMEVQRRLPPQSKHRLTWGAGLRGFMDDARDGAVTHLTRTRETLVVASLFAQDEIAVTGTVRLTLGARLDQQKYTGAGLQPSARLLWQPAPGQTAWAAVSQALRLPSRGERTTDYRLGVLPPASPLNPAPLPALLEVRGSGGYGAEHLTAWEAGWRGQPGAGLVLDASVFLHRYRGLRTASGGPPEMAASASYMVIPALFSNLGEQTLRGVEAAAHWRPVEGWRLRAAATYRVTSPFEAGATMFQDLFASQAPRRAANLLSGWRLGSRTDLDLWLVRVGPRNVPGQAALPASNRMDLRLARRLDRRVEVALVGQNLLDDRHGEYVSFVPGFAPVEVRRGIYGQIRVSD